MSFNKFGLDPKILKSIKESGYTEATPVQEKVIPEIMNGRDLQVSAPTGTGKTAAFILPTLHRLSEIPYIKFRGPQILILAPTRELAIQIAEQAKKYSRHFSKVKTVCIYGGTPYPIQNRELSRPYDILIATPGRLIDHIEHNRIDLSKLEVLILDEADRMLDMGFVEPVEQIVSLTPNSRQTLLFSATLKGKVLELSKRLLNDPIKIIVKNTKEKHENIEQRLNYVDDIEHKHKLLNHALKDSTIEQVLIFTSTKRQADKLSRQLYDDGHAASALHGDMNQRQRLSTINKMRRGTINILVATDVAARGIDIKTISHVVNFDLPMVAEDYVHRIGRTGRAGAKGVALSFVANRDMNLLRQIELFIEEKISSHTVTGLEPRQKKAAPRRGRNFNRFNRYRPSRSRKKTN